MNYEITFQPNKYNASDRELILNFKKALMRYYKKLLKARYNKHKDRQYKMDIDISHGNSEYSSTHPHLHIKADIPTNEIQFFMDFIKSYLKTKYPMIPAYKSVMPVHQKKCSCDTLLCCTCKISIFHKKPKKIPNTFSVLGKIWQGQ